MGTVSAPQWSAWPCVHIFRVCTAPRSSVQQLPCKDRTPMNAHPSAGLPLSTHRRRSPRRGASLNQSVGALADAATLARAPSAHHRHTLRARRLLRRREHGRGPAMRNRRRRRSNRSSSACTDAVALAYIRRCLQPAIHAPAHPHPPTAAGPGARRHGQPCNVQCLLGLGRTRNETGAPPLRCHPR